jgi:nucleotide-binding universal stress UspA family protein
MHSSTLPPFTIVVGVDYSDLSIAALDLALNLAENHFPAVVIPMLVLQGGPATRPAALVSASDEVLHQSERNLLELVTARNRARRGVTANAIPGAGAAAADAEQTGARFQAVATFGAPAQALTERAQLLEADLIVVGTHGRRGVQQLLLGSVAQDVVRRAHCSVLVARSAELRHVRDATPSEAATTVQDAEPRSMPAEMPRADRLFEECVVTEPHLENDRVVVHIVDRPSGLTFVCSFEDFDRLSVESLEREWVTVATGEQRGRVARAALAFSRAEEPLFETLFEELRRRRYDDS